MHLRRTAFPQRVGHSWFDTYLLWLDTHESPPGQIPLPVLKEDRRSLEAIVEDPAFQAALVELGEISNIELLLSPQGLYYVCVVTSATRPGNRKRQGAPELLPVVLTAGSDTTRTVAR